MKLKLKTKKIMGIISIVLVVLALSFGAVYAVQGDNLAKLFGKQQADILANAGNDIVATIDGEKISKKGFETYKLFINNGDNKLSDKQILEKIIERKAINDEAIKEGLSATDEEVASLVNSAQNMKENDERYLAFKEYLGGLSMTEDQYWESVKPAYKKFITCGKFKNSLKEKYAKENDIKDKTELDNNFRDYYNQYVQELKGEVKVETDIK